MRRTKPNNFAILKEYINITLRFVLFVVFDQGRPQDLGGGGVAKNFFLRFGNLHVAKQHAAHSEAMRFARGVRGHAPPRKFL